MAAKEKEKTEAVAAKEKEKTEALKKLQEQLVAQKKEDATLLEQQMANATKTLQEQMANATTILQEQVSAAKREGVEEGKASCMMPALDDIKKKIPSFDELQEVASKIKKKITRSTAS